MSLSSGDRLGPYEILSPLGAGGMGEVYRARDTTLNREVALKVLPDSFANDADRLARFTREAQTLAALNHPNIAQIYGLEQGPAEAGRHTSALVMELVEGEDLSQRIARLRAPGALARQAGMPLDEALPIARQIAEALEAAHEQGIIHRDLKPANIKVRTDGTVKVLDFGLAKAMQTAEPKGSAPQEATITTPAMTQAGMILGTAAYMAPEQAKGKPVDRRADLWALGAVLYEMLTGQRAFRGEDTTDTIVAVVSKEPDWSALPANTPASIRKLLQRCLEKDRKRRLDSAADARLEIEDAMTAPAPVERSGLRTRRGTPGGIAARAVAAVVIVVLAVPTVQHLREAPSAALSSRPLVQMDVRLGADAALVADLGPAAVLSPDGSLLAFVGRQAGRAQQLYLRPMGRLDATAVAGTDDARDPFFSPDGQWIGFFAGGKLKKVATSGGTVVTLCDAPIERGGTWAADGRIVFSPTSAGGVPLQWVSASGGVPTALTTMGEGEASQRYPQVLPGGKAVLYTSSTSLGSYNDGDIVVQPLPAGIPTTLVRGGHFGRYLPSGHLTYVHDGRLFAVAIDIDRLELAGSPVPVLESVTANTARGPAQFAFSETGTAVYLPGGSAEAARPIRWLSRGGKTTALRSARADWSNLQFSPDGRRLAMDVYDGKQTDIWVYEFARDTLTQLTFDAGEDWAPLWTPDGQRIVFRSARDRAFNLYWQRVDGSGTTQRLTTSPNPQEAWSWHPSGKTLALVEIEATNTDIMLVNVGGDGSNPAPSTPTTFLNTPASESSPAFSPDGKWIAYTSNESGRSGVYVRPFPGPGGQWLIAAAGSYPTWSRTRRELIYLGGDRRLMVSAYSADANSFRADAPRVWSSSPFATRPRGAGGVLEGRPFALHADGERVAGSALPEGETEPVQNSVVVLFNFFDELRRIAPPKP